MSTVRPSKGNPAVTIGIMVAALGLLPAVSGGSQTGTDASLTAALAPAPAYPDTPTADWLLDGAGFKADVYRGKRSDEIVLSNGLIRRAFRLSPNAATVGYDNLVTGEALLRGIKPEALVEIDGTPYEVGGLKGQPNYAFLRPEWIDQLEADPNALQFVGFETGEPIARMAWKQVRPHAPEAQWPPKGVYLRMDYRMPEAAADRKDTRVSVHYELYDGVPVLSKWITVHNGNAAPITVNSFTSEMLAAVEYGAAVEARGYNVDTPNIFVETDYAFASFTAKDANRHAVHWDPDPDYTTQVNYQLVTPCLLTVRPEIGPEQELAPGSVFESFRAFELPFDSFDRERNGLAQRRMYRTIAPWVTENPPDDARALCGLGCRQIGHRPMRRGRL